jgi:AraC family transcriptional regulator
LSDIILSNREQTPSMGVEVVDRPQIRIAAVRHVGSYMKVNEAFRRLHELAASAGLLGPDTKLIGIYHDNPETTPEDKLRADAGITLSAGARIPEGLNEVLVPSGRYAHVVHKGPYTGLGKSWDALRDWLGKSGERYGDGFSYELYRNTPMNAEPNDLVTDLYMPLK